MGVRIHKTRCRLCDAPIVFARTMATENGRGGKAMPLDAEPNPAGNVAVRVALGGRLVARVLGKDEDHDHRAEQRYMPHFATCGGRGDAIAAEAEEFLARHNDSPGATS